MGYSVSKLRIVAFLFIISISIISKGQQVNGVSRTPEEVYNSVISNPNFKTSPGGESFCWHASAEMRNFVEYYKLTKNTKYLDEGIRYFDWLIDRMITDPDGYRGWIGVYDYNRRYWGDAIVGDALLLSGMLEFSNLVLSDKTLHGKYLEKAKSYVGVAERDFFEKWDHKGCWFDDAPYGSYMFSTKYLRPDNLKEWVTIKSGSNSGVSLPFNMQSDAAELLLEMYKFTGKQIYWGRAQTIYFTAKSNFQYFDNHYCWNYWTPLTPNDVDIQRNNVKLWVGVHEWRSGYQAGEVGKIVYAYHHGIVFDKQDIQRILNTNLKVMWNGDRINPKFINSNGLGKEMDTTGVARFKRDWGHANEFKNAGELWTSLLDFDQTIRDLYELRFKDKTTDAYIRYKNTVLSSPPGFEKKQSVGTFKAPDIKFTECKELNCAAVLPHIVTDKQKSIIICKSWVAGDLKIEVYSNKNKPVLTLYNGKIKDGFFIITWDGKDPVGKINLKGDYKVRWTINGGYREFPVVVKL
jgi:hypothetical protein